MGLSLSLGGGAAAREFRAGTSRGVHRETGGFTAVQRRELRELARYPAGFPVAADESDPVRFTKAELSRLVAGFAERAGGRAGRRVACPEGVGGVLSRGSSLVPGELRRFLRQRGSDAAGGALAPERLECLVAGNLQVTLDPLPRPAGFP